MFRHLAWLTGIVAAAASAQTVLTGNLNVARSGCVATVLTDGRVLITGGYGAGGATALASAELFDPSRGQFTIAGDMHSTRSGHTATLLANGNVLIAGGGAPASAELFDGNNFRVIPAMNTPRYSHSATLLRDGTVLIAGGRSQSDGTTLADAEVFDPKSGSFVRVGSMNAPRFDHGAALLPDGRVLIAGGLVTTELHGFALTAEIYNPQTKSFALARSPAGIHLGEVLTLLDGNVLLLGIDDPPLINSISELFDPIRGFFEPALPEWTAFFGAKAIVLSNGRVLIAGGGSFLAMNNLEIFDPAEKTYHNAGALQVPRMKHAAVVLHDGRSLFIGGEDRAIVIQSSESIGAANHSRHRAVH